MKASLTDCKSDCFYLDIATHFIGHFDVQTEELNTINLKTSLLVKSDIDHIQLTEKSPFYSFYSNREW